MHWTINGSECSQFENHLRAIAGLPLGETGLVRPSLMFNWIGAMPDLGRMLSVPGLCWHDYGKAARPGRKVGHATLTAGGMGELEQRAREVAALAGGAVLELLEELDF